MASAASESSPVRCTLHLEYRSPEEAAKVHGSVSLDNEDYLQARLEGRVIIAEIEAKSLKSLLHTLDDFLSCTGVAGKIVGGKS